MDKIKVSEEIKNDLDYMLSHKDKFFILNKHINKGWVLRTSLNSLSVKEMSKALDVGYELKKTPEEELLEFYISNIREEYREFDQGIKIGIINCLEFLDIKVKGINA